MFFDQGLQKSLEATIVTALREVQVGVDLTSLPIGIQATPDGKQQEVVATTDMPKESILIPVCTSSKVRILLTSSHPQAVETTVDYNIPCAYGANSNTAQSKPTAQAAVPGGGAQSGDVAQSSTSAAADGANSTQAEQGGQTDSTAVANTSPGGTSAGSSTANAVAAVAADVVYQKGDVLKDNCRDECGK